MKYDQEIMDRYANSIEDYLDSIEKFLIYPGMTEEEFTENQKLCRKLIKKLRKGKGEDVFDRERYIEAEESGLLW